MRNRISISICLLLLALPLVFSIAAVAQQPRPYHEGPVWDVAFIRVKAGMDDRYMRYLAQDWKREQEAMKKAGYILDYKVIATEPHGPQDFNVILMTQFKDLTTLEANTDKMRELGEQLFGGQQKIESGYQDRSSWREVLADRLGREMILEPKR